MSIFSRRIPRLGTLLPILAPPLLIFGYVAFSLAFAAAAIALTRFAAIVIVAFGPLPYMLYYYDGNDSNDDIYYYFL